MAHVRQSIIAQIKAQIFNEVGSIGGRVYTSRVHPLDEGLPAVVVYPDGEAWDGEGAPGPVQFRELTAVVDVYDKATADLEGRLDDIAVQIEEHLTAGAGILKQLAKLVYLESSTHELVDDLEQPAGRLRMVWQVLYRVDTRDPTGPAS